ncbi:MAG: helix-turn-helix domain-containing protein [Lachnospiraceae bacterium]|nr:helix-turn-helix domain-containing protein [Lachnospiraceae bacterium]
MTHNELLKLARKKSGMSQSEFAGYFQMPKKTLQHWELSERKVPDYLLRLMLYKLEMEGLVSGLQEMMDQED